LRCLGSVISRLDAMTALADGGAVGLALAVPRGERDGAPRKRGPDRRTPPAGEWWTLGLVGLRAG